jgi:hypothetical protein
MKRGLSKRRGMDRRTQKETDSEHRKENSLCVCVCGRGGLRGPTNPRSSLPVHNQCNQDDQSVAPFTFFFVLHASSSHFSHPPLFFHPIHLSFIHPTPLHSTPILIYSIFSCLHFPSTLNYPLQTQHTQPHISIFK